MTTYSITHTQGVTLPSPNLSVPCGEALSVSVTMLTSAGVARDCTGGTLLFCFQRRGIIGTVKVVSTAGGSSGVFNFEIAQLTTAAMDGRYACDFWYVQASGDRERVSAVGALDILPAVGPDGVPDPGSIVADAIDTAIGDRIRAFPTCAVARANADPTTETRIYIDGRGTFAWTTAAGTDSGDEQSDYIQGTGGGFEFQPTAYMDFASNTVAPPHHEGRIYWLNNALYFMTADPNGTVEFPFEVRAPVYNGTSSTIARGTPLYASGPQGQRLSVTPAINGSGLPNRIIGLATYDIPAHSDGFATTSGLVTGIDTHLFTAGDMAYTSGTAGVLTATQPAGSTDGAILGMVMNSSPTQGAIFVRPRAFDKLAGTTATRPSSPRDGQLYRDTTLGYVVVFNGSTWVAV